MAILDSTLDLQSFYPSDLAILSVEDTDDKIIIHMHSASTSCTCHRCGALLHDSYDLTPRGIIKRLGLLDVDYNLVSAYGHFGKPGLPWEE